MDCFPNRLLGVGLSLHKKFERELVGFWRVILPRGRGVRLGRFCLGLAWIVFGWVGLAWIVLGLAWPGLAWIVFGLAWPGLAWIVFGWAWVGLDRFWLGWLGSFLVGLGWVGSFLVGLGWIVFGPDKGLAKKKAQTNSSPAARLTQV